MTAAVLEDMSLDWVTFGGDDETCDGLNEVECPLEAVARSRWAKTCPHAEEGNLHCAGHRDEVLRLVRSCAAVCADCGVPGRFIRMEPIR